MRFHHSTRRGRNLRHGQSPRMGGAGGLGQPHSLSSRWAQLTYCRQSNIHFNRRIPIEPPADKCKAAEVDEQQAASQQQHTRQAPLILRDQTGQFNYSKQDDFALVVADFDQRRRHQSAVATTTSIDDQLNRLHLNQRETSPSHSKMSSLMGNSSGAKSARHHRKQLPSSRAQPSSSPQKAPQCQESDPSTIKNSDTHSSNNNNNNNNDNRWKLDMELVREKLVAQVEKHPFWSNKAAKRMRLVSVNERRVYIYELASYCERRELEWRYEPYRGGLVAGSTPFRRPQLATSEGGGGGGGSHLAANTSSQTTAMGSVSQPTSPTGGPNSGSMLSSSVGQHQQQQQQLIELGSSMLQNNQTTLQVPIPATVSQQQQQQFQYNSHQSTTNNNNNNNNLRSPIRRSCSSAASSPAPAAAAAAATCTSLPLTYHPPIQHQTSNGSILTTASSNSAPAAAVAAAADTRPLPSAEFVWSIEPPGHLRPAPFVGYLHTLELPDSSFVKRCHGCQGRGRLKCTSCHGVGYEVCISCSGKGTMKSLSRANCSSALGSSSGASGSRYSTSGARSSDNHYSDTADSGGGGGASSFHQQYGSMWGGSSCAASESRRHHTDGEPGGITQSVGATGGGGGWISESCHFCHGAGQKRCWICAGRAYNCCLACAGTGQLRCFLNLNISWINHKDECILNNADCIIPKERLKLSSGLLLADQVAERLAPVNLSLAAAVVSGADHLLSLQTSLLQHEDKYDDTPPDGATGTDSNNNHLYSDTKNNNNNNHHHHHHHHHQKRIRSSSQMMNEQEANQVRLVSGRLLDKHLAAFKQERLIRQRQRVTQIDCFLVNWEWKRRRGHFVIYGDEQKVYIAKYPFKSICNIT